MNDKSKSILLNYYKSKLNNKASENSIFNNIYPKYSNLNSSRKESSKEKSRFVAKKIKIAKNSPYSSLNISVRDFSIEKNKFKYKNDIFKSKDAFNDVFIKKINPNDKIDKGNISQRPNVSKNIFKMYNSNKNDSSLISNRLVKNRKTANIISNVNNLNNNSNNNIDSKIYSREINNSTNNKSLFNNYKNFLNEKNTSFKNRLFNFNINKNSYMVDFKKINKEYKKNTMNNSFLKKYIININKGKDINTKIENSFNAKIRKVSSIDYLYNNKTRKSDKKGHHINYINDNKSDFNISEKIRENKIGDIESTNMNLSNRNININKFINKNNYSNFTNKKDENKNELKKNIIKTGNKNKDVFDIKFGELANNSSLFPENYLIKSIQYISNNNNCNNINNQNISINININNNERENNFDKKEKKEMIKNIKGDDNEFNKTKYKKYSIKIGDDIKNKTKENFHVKDENKIKIIGNLEEINNLINNPKEKKYKDEKNINKKEKLGMPLNKGNLDDKLNIKEKKNKIIKENNINEKRDFSPIYEEDLNVKEHINKLNQFYINKNNVSNILLKIKNDNKGNSSFNQNINDNFIKKINKKIYLEDEQNIKKNHSLSIGKKAKDLKIIEKDNIKKINKKDMANVKLIDLKEFQISKEILNDIHVLKNNDKKDKFIFSIKKAADNINNNDISYNNINNNINNNNDNNKINNNNRNKKKIERNKKEENIENDMIYVPESLRDKIKENKEITTLTLTKDSSFFKEKLCQLSLYIKNYYKENNEYPNSNLDFYLYGREVGSGAFGKVKIALHIGSGRLVAIKIFTKEKLKTERKIRKVRNEINILSKLRHPFINQILDTFETEKYVFIVMEYICADLLGFIRKREKLSENISKIIFKQIIEGLKYINKKKIVHRDIKLDNILIDLDNTVKICDFGVSKKISEDELMIDHCGTPGYISPEIYKNKGYEGFQCDIWSAGVTLYYMLSGTQPFRAYSVKEMEIKVLKGEYEEIKEVSKEANDLIKKMLVVDPEKRIKINEILNHPWLKNEDVENRKNLKLFTDNEKLLLSKYDVNYLYSNKEELIENFTLKNLESDNDETKLKNKGNTKSIIFSPFNSYIEDSDSMEENPDELEIQKLYENLRIENNICKYALIAQQDNIRYELSNNNEFDNGIIKSQKEEDIEKQNQEIKKEYEGKILDKTNGYVSSKIRSANNSFEINDNIIDEEIIKNIEENVGYNSEYIINCIKKNKINYATATYYLLKKEKNSKAIQ